MPRNIKPELVSLIDKKLASNGSAQLAIKNKDARNLMIFAAQACVGEKESGNNKGAFVELCQKTVDGKASSEPWCMAFVQSMVAYAEIKTGKKSSLYPSEHCMTTLRKAKPEDRVKKIPAPGAIVIWEHKNTDKGHTAFVMEYKNKTMETIEGNTGKLFREGDGVYQKSRSTTKDDDMNVRGFIIPFPLTEVKAEPVVLNRIALSWEKNDPKRAAWSDKLISVINKDMPLYESSTDINKILPDFKSKTNAQKLKALAEFWIALYKFESSWNPKSYSVDVGSKNDKGSWSVGLGQMSANDGAARAFKATFESLQDPIMGIDVSLEQMRRQLKNTNTIFLANSSKYRYWAVALIGNKHSKIDQILAYIKANV